MNKLVLCALLCTGVQLQAVTLTVISKKGSVTGLVGHDETAKDVYVTHFTLKDGEFENISVPGKVVSKIQVRSPRLTKDIFKLPSGLSVIEKQSPFTIFMINIDTGKSSLAVDTDGKLVTQYNRKKDALEQKLKDLEKEQMRDIREFIVRMGTGESDQKLKAGTTIPEPA